MKLHVVLVKNNSLFNSFLFKKKSVLTLLPSQISVLSLSKEEEDNVAAIL